MSLGKSKAVIHLSDTPGEATRLKRLALLFDEISFVRPSAAVLSKEASERIKERIASEDSPDVVELNAFRDINHDIEILSLGNELDETLSALEESGIAVNCGDLVSQAERDASYRRWRDPMIAQAVRDPDWNRLTHTPKDAYSRPKISEVRIQLDSGGEDSFLWFEEPPAVWCADDIARASHLAQVLDAFPLFPEEFRPLLQIKYDQYKRGAENLGQEKPVPINHRASFGEAAFAIVNSVFSSHSVEEKSVEQILKYREEMELARQRFLSNDLVELESLISANPWGPDAEAEISRFVNGKLSSDVATFENESVSTWEKLYGALAVHSGGLVQSGAVGGGIGGIAAHVIPFTSFWQVLIGGLAVGAAKELPDLVGDVASAVNEERERNRSGIAYIAKFNNPDDRGSGSFFKRSR